MKALLAILALLALCTPVRGDIVCKPYYEQDEPIVVEVVPDTAPPGAVLRRAKFKVAGANYFQFNESLFGIWAKPGKYTIEVSGSWRLYQEIEDKEGRKWKVIADEDDYEYVKSIEVAGGPPIPPPPPPPPPGKRWAVIWEETEQRTPAQGNLFIQLRNKYQDEKLTIKDVTVLPPKLRTLESQRPQNLPLPVLMVVARQPDGTDKVIRTVPCPSSVDAVEQEVAK